MKTFQNLLKSILNVIGEKSVNKEKKVSLIITEFLTGLGSAKTTSRLSILSPIVGVFLTSNTALLTSIVILIRKKHISKI